MDFLQYLVGSLPKIEMGVEMGGVMYGVEIYGTQTWMISTIQYVCACLDFEEKDRAFQR